VSYRDITKEKKVCFKDTELNYANLLIRLRYDNLKQNEFFKLLIKKYIGNDKDMLKMIQSYKLENKTMGKTNINNSRKDVKKSEELMQKIGLTDSDVEHLFDLIEFSDGQE